jgi:hypothetical protein
MTKDTVLFEQALAIALEQTKKSSDISNEITLVRDLRGRIRLLLPGSEESYRDKEERLLDLRTELSKALGNYGFPPDKMILYRDELAVADHEIQQRLLYSDQNIKVFLLDRQITGQDWLMGNFERKTSNPRATLFGIKGGVGRSTALIIWAWYLAKHGKKVLIFDLDLESPGVSSTLLPTDFLPDFGIVDWFVEDGVGQADAVENDMFSRPPIAQNLEGEITIVPAYGRKTADYMAKLSRCYAGLPGDEKASWGARLATLVEKLEEQISPDVTILDSRAGVQDIAAVAITRMDAFAFLFAIDSAQTWKAYEFLFTQWRGHPHREEMRTKLQITASMIPETGRDDYLQRFREHAWDLFRENLYDEELPGSVAAFNFDLNDEDAPHYPLPVYWHRALQEFDPFVSGKGFEERTAEEALGEFVKRADCLVFPPEDKES